MARFFFSGNDLLFRLRDGGEKVAIFYEGDFARALLEGYFEVNLNGWTPEEVVYALIDEGLLQKFFLDAKKAYDKLYWANRAAVQAGGDTASAYEASVSALLRGDIKSGTPLYIAQRCDVKKHSSSPFGNDENFGGDRWASKGINVMSHRDHVDSYEAKKRVQGTDLPVGIAFRNVAVEFPATGELFKIQTTSDVEVEKINSFWDRNSNVFKY